MFVYEISGCEFESRGCHSNFRCRACFKQGVPWHSWLFWYSKKDRFLQFYILLLALKEIENTKSVWKGLYCNTFKFVIKNTFSDLKFKDKGYGKLPKDIYALEIKTFGLLDDIVWKILGQKFFYSTLLLLPRLCIWTGTLPKK